MIVTRVAGLFALMSLLIAVYGGAKLVPALLKSGVVFLVAFAMLYLLQITITYAYRRVKEEEYREEQEKAAALAEKVEEVVNTPTPVPVDESVDASQPAES
jgi:membrane protein implicated in regulation of membrane protease activity